MYVFELTKATEEVISEWKKSQREALSVAGSDSMVTTWQKGRKRHLKRDLFFYSCRHDRHIRVDYSLKSVSPPSNRERRGRGFTSGAVLVLQKSPLCIMNKGIVLLSWTDEEDFFEALFVSIQFVGWRLLQGFPTVISFRFYRCVFVLDYVFILRFLLFEKGPPLMKLAVV